MARFCTLSSSSSGNCEYLSASGESLLIDAGVSCKKIVDDLYNIGEDIKNVKGILLTHYHGDHCGGLKTLQKKYNLPLYATKETFDELIKTDILSLDDNMHIIKPKETFEIATMRITAFSTMHDALGSVGYRIETNDEHIVSIVTDLGMVTKEVEDGIFGSDLVLLEANHDEYMLKVGSYPKALKSRIASPYGHLSNEDAANLACRMIVRGTKYFVLGHLSESNNTPEMAERAVYSELCKFGKEGKDFMLYTSPARTCSELVRF